MSRQNPLWRQSVLVESAKGRVSIANRTESREYAYRQLREIVLADEGRKTPAAVEDGQEDTRLQEEDHDDVKFSPVSASTPILDDAQRPTPTSADIEQAPAPRPQSPAWVSLSLSDEGKRNATTASRQRRRSEPVSAIKFWDRSEQPISYWYEVLARTVEKLYTEGLLTADDAPVRGPRGPRSPQGRYIVNTKPPTRSTSRRHQVEGTPFFVEKNVAVETIKKNTTILLKRFGPEHAEVWYK